MLNWQSSSDDFRLATTTEIIALYNTATAITLHSSRVRRLSETVLGKRIGHDGLREYHNHCFAWENFNCPYLRVPEPIRFVESPGRASSSSGILIMEHLQGTALDSITNEWDSKIIECVAQAIRYLHNHAMKISCANTIGSFTDSHTDGFPWGQNGVRSFRDIHGLESAVNSRLAICTSPAHGTIHLQGEELAFCHMDLAPRNILLLKDGTIAIVDWMTLAIYPVIFEWANLAFLARTARPHEKKFLEAVCQRISDCKSEEEVRMLNIVHTISMQYSFDDK